jgi:hypothetical protein
MEEEQPVYAYGSIEYMDGRVERRPELLTIWPTRITYFPIMRSEGDEVIVPTANVRRVVRRRGD